MYLISAYFDEETDRRIKGIISRIEKATGNEFISRNKIPPHITLSSLDHKNEAGLVECMNALGNELYSGDVYFVSAAQFLPSVMYISPLMDKYLFESSMTFFSRLSMIEGIKLSRKYRPYSWIPHITIAKHMNKFEMCRAFEVIQDCFEPFRGRICEVGLAKSKPYKDILRLKLKERRNT